MKPKVHIILLFISLYACNTSLKPDDDFGIDKKNRGEFLSEFVGLNKKENCTSYTFKNGKGETIDLNYIRNFEGNSSETFLNLDNQEIIYPKSNSLKDSIDENPNLFIGRLIKVNWSSFSHFRNEIVPTDEQYDNSQIGGGDFNVSITFWKTNILLSMTNPYDSKGQTEIEKKEPTKDYEQSNNTSEIKSTKKSFSEIRGLIISGKRNTVIDVLGEPNEKLLGSDYSVKYLHFKLGMRHDLTLMDYLVWIYNIDENELLVVFDKEDKVCKVAYSKDIKQPYDLTE